MTFGSLENVSFDEIMDCFYEAFENYFVPMPTDRNYFKKRWTESGLRYDLSYGAFDGDKLVGFILHAVDYREGNLTAFNNGTGVIPQWRGKKIVKAIYDYAIPELKKHGVYHHALEVIKENKVAVKAYESVGFEIVRGYKCYNGQLNLGSSEFKGDLKKVDAGKVYELEWTDLGYYSWENRKDVVLRGTYDFYLLYDENPMGYFVIDPNSGYIPQFETVNKTDGEFELLFTAIRSIAPTIKINNVDERLASKVSFLNHLKLNNPVDQFEMRLKVQ